MVLNDNKAQPATKSVIRVFAAEMQYSPGLARRDVSLQHSLCQRILALYAVGYLAHTLEPSNLVLAPRVDID